MATSPTRMTTGSAITVVGSLLFAVDVAAWLYPGFIKDGFLFAFLLWLSASLIGLGLGVLTKHPFVGLFVGFSFWCGVSGIGGLLLMFFQR